MQVLKKVEAQESGPHLLKELQKAWDNHAVMVRWLTRFFNYLDRCALLAALTLLPGWFCGKHCAHAHHAALSIC